MRDPMARSGPTALQHLRARAGATTPRILLAEAIAPHDKLLERSFQYC
jgi:hypothetical protein